MVQICWAGPNSQVHLRTFEGYSGLVPSAY